MEALAILTLFVLFIVLPIFQILNWKKDRKLQKNIDQSIADAKEFQRKEFDYFVSLSKMERFITKTFSENPHLKSTYQAQLSFSCLFRNSELNLLGFENFIYKYNFENFDSYQLFRDIMNTDMLKYGFPLDMPKYIEKITELHVLISNWKEKHDKEEMEKEQTIRAEEEKAFCDPLNQNYKRFRPRDNMNDLIGIYMIYESNTGKFYIGSTNNIKKRITQHLSELRNGSHHSYKLQEVYDQYGENSLEYYIIEIINIKEISKPENATEDEQLKNLKKHILQKEQQYLYRFHPSLNVFHNVYEYQKRFGGHWF